MKNIIRLSALVLVLVLCAGLVACGEKETADQTGGTTAPTETVGMSGGVGDRGDYDNEATNEPDDTTVPPTTEDAPTDGETEPTEGTVDPSDPHDITLEQFESMSAEQQQAFADTFPSFEEFVDWLRAKRGESGGDVVVIGDGNIDLGDYTP